MPPSRGPSGDPPGAKVRTISHQRRDVESIGDAVEEEMRHAGYPAAACFAVRLAWEEAASNAIHHGNRDRPEGRIEVATAIDGARVYLRVTDEGQGFDPAAVIDPTLDENLECASGRGLLLMRAYMTRIEFEPPGNTVRMVYEADAGRA